VSNALVVALVGIALQLVWLTVAMLGVRSTYRTVLDRPMLPDLGADVARWWTETVRRRRPPTTVHATPATVQVSGGRQRRLATARPWRACRRRRTARLPARLRRQARRRPAALPRPRRPAARRRRGSLARAARQHPRLDRRHPRRAGDATSGHHRRRWSRHTLGCCRPRAHRDGRRTAHRRAAVVGARPRSARARPLVKWRAPIWRLSPRISLPSGTDLTA
jgi:hypothetical protein